MQQLLIGLAAGLLGWGLTGLVLAAVRNAEHLALPTDRGLHKIPTPVGGGLGLIGATLVVWLLVGGPVTSSMTVATATIVALAAISWIDDVRPLHPALRFVAQAFLVAAAIWNLQNHARLLPSIPISGEHVLLGLGWLWMLNLTNFMDGIDGMAGAGAVAVAAGYALLLYLHPGGTPLISGLPELAIALAAASLGYLYWNWAPARIFMGDVGSIPLGFVFGLMMFDLALRGHRAAAVILPLYFVVDATSTLMIRLWRGAKPWQAHREHAYQAAVLGGMTHAQVTTHVAVLNFALIALAILSIKMPSPALAVAFALTTALVVWFRARPQQASSDQQALVTSAGADGGGLA